MSGWALGHSWVGRVINVYLSRAEVRFEVPEGVVVVSLLRWAPGSHFMICAPDGKAARTFYRVLAETKGAEGEPRTLLACCIEHGRTHQIRVHMARIGHPLVGDSLYGNGFFFFLFWLHAWKLSLHKLFGSDRVGITAERPGWAAFYEDRPETGIFGKPFV